jgi:hypothetical protein
MPTSVGPNTKGEENLVFGYDLGDSSNSYKGEPVENLQTVDEGNVYTSVSTVNTTAELVDMVTPFGNKAWKITIPASGTNGYSSTRAQGPAVTINRDGTYYYHGAWVWMSDDDYALWVQSSNYIYKYSTGSNGLGKWIHRSALDRRDRAGRIWKAYGTWNALTAGGTASERHTFFKNGTLTRDLLFYIVAPMWGVGKSHPVQFTAGTRSTTQGLIDLTGNSTIDLTNVSFDSNAQMTFDGTNDTISVPSYSAIELVDNVSIEYVYKRLSTDPILDVIANKYHSTGWELFCTTANKFALAGRNGDGTYYSMSNGAYTIQNNQYYHLVAIKEGLSWRLYVNGELYAYLTANTVGTWSNTGILQLGGEGNGYYPNMQLPVFKIFNRVLTASEIKANYNAIKGRFNI